MDMERSRNKRIEMLNEKMLEASPAPLIPPEECSD